MEDAKNLYLVIDSVELGDAWEPETDQRCILVGVYDTKERAEEAKKTYNEEQRCARVVKAPLNRMAKDKTSDTGFVELDSFWSYDDDMYDDPMDI